MDETDARHDDVVALFSMLMREKSIVLTSERHVKEMKSTGNLEEFERVQSNLWKNRWCLQVQSTEFDRQLALRHNEKFKVGFGDCLHLILADTHKAIACSYDRHWHTVGKELGIKVYYPRDLLYLGN